MGIFDKHVLLYEGKNRLFYQGYQGILQDNNIKFKAYATDDQFKSGCCGANNSSFGLHNTDYSYTIFVKEKEAETAKALIKQFKLQPVSNEEY